MQDGGTAWNGRSFGEKQETEVKKTKQQKTKKRQEGKKVGLPDALQAVKPVVHVNTLSLHVELCHRSLATGQFTGPFHSVFKNTQIYGQINWVQLPLVLLG